MLVLDRKKIKGPFAPGPWPGLPQKNVSAASTTV